MGVNCITGATRGLSYKREGRPLMGSLGAGFLAVATYYRPAKKGDGPLD
jgi:hypothetical protein